MFWLHTTRHCDGSKCRPTDITRPSPGDMCGSLLCCVCFHTHPLRRRRRGDRDAKNRREDEDPITTMPPPPLPFSLIILGGYTSQHTNCWSNVGDETRPLRGSITVHTTFAPLARHWPYSVNQATWHGMAWHTCMQAKPYQTHNEKPAGRPPGTRASPRSPAGPGQAIRHVG